MINFFRVEAGLLDLEEQPPVNQCHSLSTMTAAQSWLYNVWLWDSQQLCLLHSGVWWEGRGCRVDVCRRRRVVIFTIVITRAKASDWPAAPPLLNNPIIACSILTGDPSASAAGPNESIMHVWVWRATHLCRTSVPVNSGWPTENTACVLGTIFPNRSRVKITADSEVCAERKCQPVGLEYHGFIFPSRVSMSSAEPAVPQLLLLFVLMQTRKDLRQQHASTLNTLWRPCLCCSTSNPLTSTEEIHF